MYLTLSTHIDDHLSSQQLEKTIFISKKFAEIIVNYLAYTF